MSQTIAPGHKTAGRRILDYPSVEAIMPDVDRLLEGHVTVGRWSLGQICNHLTFAFVASLEGFPSRPLPAPLRATAGRLLLNYMFRSRRIPEGVRLPKKFAPKPELDARAEAEALRAAIRIFLSDPEPKGVHPFFGRLTKSEWERYHQIHSAHHLSFAVPTEGASGSRAS